MSPSMIPQKGRSFPREYGNIWDKSNMRGSPKGSPNGGASNGWEGAIPPKRGSLIRMNHQNMT